MEPWKKMREKRQLRKFTTTYRSIASREPNGAQRFVHLSELL